MYWFFNCNNYEPKAIKALVYSAKIFNPDFKPICVWDEPEVEAPDLKKWLEDQGVLVVKHKSPLAEKIISLKKQEDFDFGVHECPDFPVSKVGLEGMWSKADVPKLCEKLGIKDDFVLVTDPDCIFFSKYDLELDWPNDYAAVAAGPEEEPYREWISGGIYVFNVKRMLEDRLDFWEFVIQNYREIGFAENLALMQFYGYKNIVHIPPDWNYKPYWKKDRGYLVSPVDGAYFKAQPKLVHFQGVYKPWSNPPMPQDTDMQFFCDVWKEYVELANDRIPRL